MKVRVKRIDVEGLRLQMGCSMEAMAAYLGISKSAYSMMQGGRRTLPIKSQQRAEDLKAWIDEAKKAAAGQSPADRKPEKWRIDDLKSRFRKTASSVLDLRAKIERIENEYQESLSKSVLLKEMKAINARDKASERANFIEMVMLSNELKLRINNLSKIYQLRADLVSKEAEVKYLAKILDLKMPV